MVRRAFKTAESERPGAVYLAVPEDVDEATDGSDLRPLRRNVVQPEAPSPKQIKRAGELLRQARRPVILAGHGAARGGAEESLAAFATALDVSTATTFHGKGVLPDDHPCATGTFGFMRRDYTNFGFEEADVVIAVGYELQEFDPSRINPDGDKKIIHIHRVPAEVDDSYSVDVASSATSPPPSTPSPPNSTACAGPSTTRTPRPPARCWPRNSNRAPRTSATRSPRSASSPTPAPRSVATTSCWSTPAR